MSGAGVGSGVTMALVLLGLVLLVLWVALPFAVFGIKDRLNRLLAEQRRTNELLERLAGEGHRTIEPRSDGVAGAPGPNPIAWPGG